MTRTSVILLSAVLILLAMIPTVTSTLILSDVSLTPNTPLVTGGQQHLVATYTLIPPGAATFATGHVLQMQTGLSDAKWSIQVTLDGRNAAQQSATGNSAFINGELLSYSLSHDVGLIVTIEGSVPQTPNDQLMVLQVEEINNSGNVVPDSVITINQPVTGQTIPATPSAVPTRTPPTVTHPPTKSAGVPAYAGLFATSIALVFWHREKLSP
jgi:hypothetical protein